nr:transcriptional regulator [Erysipelotrichaceae bacterium]
VLKVAEYSNEEKSRFLRRLHYMFIAGFIGFVLFAVISIMGLENTSPYEAIGSFGLGVAFGMVIIGMIFTSRYAGKIREFKMRLLHRQ